MQNNYYNTKTLGPVSSFLITQLKKSGESIFGIKKAMAVLKKDEKSTADLLSELVKRNILLRLKSGLFLIVPLEAGSNYLENKYIVARELINSNNYYISHYSAMALHGLTTQPILKVFTTAAKREKNRLISGVEFIFIYCKPGNLFGIEEKWITKQEKIRVSNIEKTIVDAMIRPELCGGISEIAKGIWLVKNRIDFARLADYCEKAGIKSAVKRMGFILQELNLGSGIIDRLGALVENSASYALLDPALKKQGRYLKRWRLRINFNPEELKSIIWA
jgi:predicted transcriptional regulator of viral defense system